MTATKTAILKPGADNGASGRRSRGNASVSNRLHLQNHWQWTVEDFQRASDLGVFGSDVKLELIAGEIIRKMTQKEAHAWAIRAMEEALRRIYATGHDTRVQLPLILTPQDKPEPDVAVVSGSFHDYKRTHPTTAALVVEVSDTTLKMDQTGKAAAYARAGIPEYWIVNLNERVLEVHRHPASMPGQPLGHGYKSLTRYLDTDTVAPIDFPDALIAVASLLP